MWFPMALAPAIIVTLDDLGDVIAWGSVDLAQTILGGACSVLIPVSSIENSLGSIHEVIFFQHSSKFFEIIVNSFLRCTFRPSYA